jgi:hypothetical protein
MPHKVAGRLQKQPCFVINRTAFRDAKLAYVAQANKVGKKIHWRDEQKYFSQEKLDKILDGLS